MVAREEHLSTTPGMQPDRARKRVEASANSRQGAEDLPADNGYTTQSTLDKLIGTEVGRLMGQQLNILSQVLSQQLAIIQHCIDADKQAAEKKSSPTGQTEQQYASSRDGDTIARASEQEEQQGEQSPQQTWQAKRQAQGETHAIPEKVPLTEAQKQLWLLTRMEGNTSCHETMAVQMDGRLQLVALHSAIQKVVDRHEALRTRIDCEGEWQYIQPDLTIEMPTIDFAGEHGAGTQIEQWLEAERERGFDLVHGPLVRFSLLKQAEQQHVFVLSAHQITVDSWSMGVILREICACYNAACNNVPCDLAQSMQFRDYIYRQKQQSEECSTNEAAWLAQFQEPLPVLELPTDHPRQARQCSYGAQLNTKIDEQLSHALKRLSEQNGCTLFTTLLAGYTALLHRITGQDDVIVGVPVAGRMLEGSESLVGYCTNLVPLRSMIGSAETFLEHLNETKKSWLDSYARHEYPLSTLINQLRPPHDPSRSPLVNCTFNLERALDTPCMHDLTVYALLPHRHANRFDLSLNVLEQSDELLLLQFDYNPELFDEDSIKRLQGYLRALFECIVSDIEQPLKSIPILPQEEIQQQFIEWNATWGLYPLDKGVHQLFEVQAKKNPAAIAIEQQGRQISYQELNARANQIAHYLKNQLNLQPEQCIGLICEHTIELIIAIVGILKAGGTYLPIAHYSYEHTKFIIQDAQVPLVFSQAHLKAQTEGLGAEILYLDDDADLRKLAEQEEGNPAGKIEMGQRASIIYTSDSKGLSKGVEVTHNNLLNLIYWHLQHFSTSSEDSATLIASPTFDVPEWELWPHLIAGVRIKIPDEATLLSAPALRDWLIEQKVNFCYLPAPLTEAMVALPWPEQVPLRILVTGGDIFYQTRHPLPFQLYNFYGPTEYTAIAAAAEVQYGENRLPAIGTPLANTQLYVLDSQLQPLPIGAPGELYIGGDGLTRGYLHHPDLTAEKFVPHPYSLEPGARLYRTGDLVRYRTNGTLDFLAHIDQQNKPQGQATGEISLTPIQHRFFGPDNPEGQRRNLSILLTVKQSLNHTFLRMACQELLRRHDGLRARYTLDGADWRQTFVEVEEKEVFHSVDLSGVAEEEQLLALERVANEAEASLNLANGPLLCVVYFDLGKQQDRLLFTVHRQAIDIISWYALLEDLRKAYLCMQQGETVRELAKISLYEEQGTELVTDSANLNKTGNVY